MHGPMYIKVECKVFIITHQKTLTSIRSASCATNGCFWQTSPCPLSRDVLIFFPIALFPTFSQLRRPRSWNIGRSLQYEQRNSPPPSHLTDKVPLLTFEPSKILFYNVCLLRSTPCVVLRRRNGIVLAALSCKGWIKSSVNELAAIPVTLQKRAFFFSFFFSITLFSLLLRFPFVSALNSSDHTFHTIFVVNEAKRFLPVIIELLLSGIWVLPFCLATCKTSAFLPASSF